MSTPPKKPNFAHYMTVEEFKEKIDTINHRYAIMYAFASELPEFKKLDVVSPADFAHDTTVIRDFVTSKVKFKV